MKTLSLEQSIFIAGFIGLFIAAVAVVLCFFLDAKTNLPQVLVAIAATIPVVAALFLQVFTYNRERKESREDKAYTMFIQLIDNYKDVSTFVASSSIEEDDKERFTYACKALSVFLSNHKDYARFKTYRYVVRSQFSSREISLLIEYAKQHPSNDLKALLQVINNN